MLIFKSIDFIMSIFFLKYIVLALEILINNGKINIVKKCLKLKSV